MLKKVILTVWVVTLGGCTYTSQTATIAAAAAEVRSDRRINLPAVLVFDSQYDQLSANARVSGLVCSAHSYPSIVGPAVKESVRRAFEATFASVDVAAGPSTNPDAVMVNIRHEAYTPMVQFAAGFWSSSASAQSEIVMRITVEHNGRRIIHPITVAGQGSAMGISGGCDAGATALTQANEQALRRLMENLAYRVINSGDMQAALAMPQPSSTSN